MWQNILYSLVSVFGVAIFTFLFLVIMNYFISKTKNENIRAVLVFAKQAVIRASNAYDTNDDIKKDAISHLTNRINGNSLGKKFNEDAVKGYVYEALEAIKKENGELNDTNN